MISRPYRHVVLLGVDGAGSFFTKTPTPAMDAIFAGGAVSHTVLTAIPTISAQCWGSMLLGVTPEVHRLTNSVVSSERYDTDSPFPSTFRIIREQMPDAILASFCHWNPINFGIIEEGLGVHKDTAPNDVELTDKICAYLEETVPTYLFIQLDDVDDAGHHYGYGTEGHLNQITASDVCVGRVFEAYRRRGVLEDTLFMVTADHGGEGHNHGGITDEERLVSLFAYGRDVPAGEILDMEIRDCPSVVLCALGLEAHQPATWTGRVPGGLFTGVTAGERPVYTAPEIAAHRHTNRPTPAASVVDVLGKDRVIAHFPMDGSLDEAGGMALDTVGKFYFVEGYHGEGIRMDDGYAILKDWQPGTESFSVAFWLQIGPVVKDPALLSNKNWRSGGSPGFVVSVQDGNITTNAADGHVRADGGFLLPELEAGSWIHVIASFDREAEELGLVCDFGAKRTSPIPVELRGVTFSADYPVTMGQDGTGDYYAHLSPVVDDVTVIRGVLTEAEIAALKAYYAPEWL